MTLGLASWPSGASITTRCVKRFFTPLLRKILFFK